MILGLQKISRKLPLALLGSAIVVAAGVGLASNLLASRVLALQARQNLATVAFERGSQLSGYLEGIKADLLQTAKSSSSNLNSFAKAWASLTNAENGTSAAATLQQAFFTGDPAARLNIDKVPGLAPTYAITHSMAQPTYRAQLASRGYSDLYLFDLSGHLVYSAAKREDFATGFAAGDGPFAESALGRLFRDVVSEHDDELKMADFAPYAAAGNLPLAFMAVPVLDATKTPIGVIAVSFSADVLGSVIDNRQGLGETGETIIVGGDGLARSDLTLTDGDDVLKPTVFNDTIRQVIEGGGANDTESLLNGTEVVAAAVPLRASKDVSWALVAEMDKSEIFAPVTTLTELMAAVGLALLVVVGVIGWFFSRGITGPITRLTRSMNALARGSLDTEVEGASKQDELGEMARAVEVFKDNARQVAQMSERDKLASDQRRADRAAMMSELQRAFGAVVEASVRGDFSQRVLENFPDAELNTLARSVNNLVETVDRGLRETGQVLSSLANANLSMRVRGDYEGAFRELKDDTNRVCEQLADIMRGLQSTSRQLKFTIAELAAGADDLSSRTTRQSAAIEETSAALLEVQATIHDNAERAAAASSRAREVSASAVEGGLVMSKASQAMDRILHSSGQIVDIIGLIDNIAFQTNLLALNASVEAARAGDAGQGFAVVAVEVRRLAQSAAQASAKVKTLVEQSGTDVATGTHLVQDAARRLIQIEAAAKDSSGLIERIASATRDQASAVAQVSVAMQSIDEMTQHNAALVEETNATMEQTSARAVELDQVAEIFTVDHLEKRQAA